METPDAGLERARQRLTDLRNTLLTLHKALLDSEKTSYELVHGSIPSAGAFLQLLINDNWFAWLRPITTLLVQIDESLAAKKPPATARDLEQLIVDTGALLSPPREKDGFWKRYSGVVQRDPGVAVLHRQMEQRVQDARA
jgi:hypothetical protein